MSDFTLSSAHLIMHCQYPFRDDVVMPPEAGIDKARDKGISLHDCQAKYINARDSELLDPATNPAWACARAWIDANWKPSWVAEPAYAWDPIADTARLLGVDIHREYARAGKLPHEKAGTLDIRSVEGDTVYVYEIGTGYEMEHKADQLRLQCLVAARAHDVPRAIGQRIQYRDDGAYMFPPVELDEFDLAAIAGEYAEHLGSVEGSEPMPGDHCALCNLAPVCPAASGIVQALIPAEAIVRPGWGLVIANPDHARWLLDHARLVAAAAEAVKEAVKAYVPKNGLVLADGSLLVEGTRNMPRRDNKKIEMLARTLGATEEQLASCDYIAVESSGLRVKKPKAEAKPRKKRAA